MADATLHSMTNNTAPAPTDELYLLDDPTGTPADNRVSYINFFNFTGLTADTTPEIDADYAVSYDNSAGSAKKVLLQNVSPLEIVCGVGAASSPADATTYYWGTWDGLGLTTTADRRRHYILKAGVITTAHINILVSGTLGSSTTSTMSVRLNDTTDYTLSSAIVCNSVNNPISVTGLSITVAQFDNIMIKWVTPTWPTNPTNIYAVVKLLVQ